MGRRAAWHGGLLAVQIAALLVLAYDALPLTGFPLDDAWIHQVVARNFAETGVLGFDPLRHGSGATSYLWALLLSLQYTILPIGPVLFTVVLAGICHLAAGQLLLALLRNDGFDARSGFGLAALFGIAGNSVWFVFSGMEASLLIFLTVAAVHSWRSRRPWLAGIALAAAFLTRPEAILLGPLLFGLDLFFPRGQRLRTAAQLLLPPMLAAVAYAAINYANTGTVSPATLDGRRWLWLQPLEGQSRLEQAAWMLWQWAARLSDYTLGSEAPHVVWISLGLAAGGVVGLLRRTAMCALALVAWTLVHLAVYALTMPSPGHGGRYQPLVPGLFLLLAALGAMDLFGAALGRRRGAAVLAGCIPFAVASILCLLGWSRDHALAVAHVDRTEVGMGRVIAMLPADARVASYDVGGIGFAAGRRVEDLGGLSDPAVAALLREGTVWRWLRARGITHVVLPLAYDDGAQDPMNFGERLGLFRNRAIELELERELISPVALWVPGINATWNSAPRQVLYRVRFRP